MYTLEVIREENDKKILALYNEYVVQLLSLSGVHFNARMKDMMAVLIQ